jgi:hypothetical protein
MQYRADTSDFTIYFPFKSPAGKMAPPHSKSLFRAGIGEQATKPGSVQGPLGYAPAVIRIRHIGNCLKAGRVAGKGVADALGILLDKGKCHGSCGISPFLFFLVKNQ